MILFLAPNPALDRAVEVGRLEVGKAHRLHPAVEVAGGKALNAARVASTLGATVAAVALLGGDRGLQVEQLAGAEGVPCTRIPSGAATRICTSVRSIADATTTELYEEGASPGAGAFDRFVATALELAADPVVAQVVAAGSLPPGVEPGELSSLLTRVARLGPTGHGVAVDLSGPALAAALAAGPALVKVNRKEAAEVVGAGPTWDAEALAEALAAMASQPATVVVTAGQEGAALVTEDGARWRARPPALGPYPVGCGDAFFGGMLAARQAGTGWEESLRVAVGAAGANAERPGPGCLDPERARLLSSATVAEQW